MTGEVVEETAVEIQAAKTVKRRPKSQYGHKAPKVKNLSKYKHLIGFIPQEDILHEEATVRQNLEIYGRLRAIPNYKEKAQKIIDDLGLRKCADTLIGNSMIRGVSGGEKKRACIGVELISDPKVLFLDEPTTGIDAYTALEVMKCLKRLNEKKKC